MNAIVKCARMAGVIAALISLQTTAALSGSVEILAVKAEAQSADTWRFSVTLKHADTGWKHYADRWRVETPDGAVLGSRVLHHPHVEEQPFTRSLSNVAIPKGIASVVIRARDSKHGWSDATRTVDLNR